MYHSRSCFVWLVWELFNSLQSEYGSLEMLSCPLASSEWLEWPYNNIIFVWVVTGWHGKVCSSVLSTCQFSRQPKNTCLKSDLSRLDFQHEWDCPLCEIKRIMLCKRQHGHHFQRSLTSYHLTERVRFTVSQPLGKEAIVVFVPSVWWGRWLGLIKCPLLTLVT